MTPRIEMLPATPLMGICATMSFAQNTTKALWKQLMPRRHEILNRVGNDYYSVEVFPYLQFFEHFEPTHAFVKWAAVKVDVAEGIPMGMSAMTIPSGMYVVFTYQGKSSAALAFYHDIFFSWMPASGYQLDNRPHMALMGEKYKREADDSEEEIWIPVLKI